MHVQAALPQEAAHSSHQEERTVYHRPTPSPQKRRQDTLTQNEWGARPIPSGWTEHTDGSGVKFYIQKVTQRWAPTYEHMFVPVPADPSPPLKVVLTQRSSSNSQETESQAGSQQQRKKKRKNREEVEVLEVGTEMLPGSEELSSVVARRMDDENTENYEEYLKANENDQEKSNNDDQDSEDFDDESTEC